MRMIGARIPARLLMLLLLLSAYKSWTADAATSVSTQFTSSNPALELPFRLFRGYVIVVQGSLGDLSAQQLLIDTGSSPTIVDRSVASHLQLTTGPAQLLQLNGKSNAETSILPSLALGPITRRRVPVLVADLSFAARELGVHIDGVIGLDVLGVRNFSIDYSSHKMIFGPLPNCTHSLPFETAPPLVSVKAEVEGRSMRLLVDTGASGLMLFRGRKSGGLLPITNFQHSDNISGTFIRERVELSDLRLGTLFLHEQTAFLVLAKGDISQNFDGIAGIPALGIKQIAFDFEHGILSWK